MAYRKHYKGFYIKPIDPSDVNGWWTVDTDSEHVAKTVNEEEARRVVWANTGRGKYITDEMMEKVGL